MNYGFYIAMGSDSNMSYLNSQSYIVYCASHMSIQGERTCQ